MKWLNCILSLFLIINSDYSFSQNLVRNPGFEDTISCPNDMGQVEKCVGWKPVNNTPDYFNTCNGNYCSVPSNDWGYQLSLSGNAYMGMITYSSLTKNQREIIIGELESTLIKGKRYYVSFRFNRTDYTKFATDNFGVSFSTIAVTQSYNFNKIIKDRSIMHSADVNGDSINWKTVAGSFIADSNYRYIMIGNFYSDSLTTVGSINSKYSDWAYYYVDDICVSEDAMTCFNQVSIKSVSDKPLIEVYPNPFNDVLNIKFGKTGRKRVTIYNSLSNIVFQAYFTESISIFDLKSLPEGVYFCTVEDDSGLIFKNKILKE